MRKHRADSRHRQIQVERVVPQRYEAILQIKPLGVLMLGEQVNRKDTDLLRHIAGRLQEVEQKQLAQALSAAGQVDGKPPKMCRRQRVSG